MRISIKQLQIIEAIIETRSYSLAAERLHMTQPAVSMQMKQLQENIDIILFERQGKRIMPTQAGLDIHGYSRKIIALHEDLQAAIQGIKELHSGRIKVSAATTANHLITQMIANFSKIDSDISVALNITNRKQLIQQLQNFEPDLVIMGEPPANLELTSKNLVPNPLVIIAHPEHELAGNKNIPFKKIAEYEFIVRERGSGTRATIKRFFANHDEKFKTTLEMGSNEAIKHAVTAGLGLGIVSLHTIKLELEAKKLVILRVQHFPIMRYWHIVRRKGKHFSLAAQQFQDFIIKEAVVYADGYKQFLE
jgi:DNA-binding transcriptional LysR family regulator